LRLRFLYSEGLIVWQSYFVIWLRYYE
jgi:hypothetical protein